MEEKKGIWKMWTAAFVLFAIIAAATVKISDSPVLNITGKGTKELIVIDAGHGGIQGRPKKSATCEDED